MANSAHESVLATMQQVIAAAAIVPPARVTRARVDAFGPDEVPAINLRRAPSQINAYGQGVDQALMEVAIDHLVYGKDWETAADALHMAVHAALAGSPVLAGVCRGLRCIRTEPRAEPGDQTAGRLTATYQAQALVRQSDLTTSLR